MNIVAVDGQLTRQPSIWNSGHVHEVEICPGRHLMELSFVMGGNIESTSNAVVAFEAQPGRTYLLHVAVIEEGFWSEFGKALVGGRGQYTAWIVDATTNETVGGREPSPGAGGSGT